MRYKQISEVADVQTGPFGSQLHKDDYVSVGTPIVTVEHLGSRIFTEQNLPQVSDIDKARLSKYVLKEGDVVFSRVGSVDRCSYVDKNHDGWMFSGRCLRVRPYDVVDSLFLYYFFCLEKTKEHIRNIAVGATMPSINTKLLGEIEIAIPKLETQQKIVAILSSLDDKIELNQKINYRLQQQVQAIFKYWFADGKEPNGFLVDICQFSKDRVAVSFLDLDNYYSTENMLPGKAGAIQATNLPTTAQTTGCKTGDVLISNIRPYFKKIVYCQSDCGCSTDVLCFHPRTPSLSAYLFCTLYADRFFDFMVAGSKGTKMPRGDKQQIMTYAVSLPSSDDLRKFNIVAVPILSAIEQNRRENKSLTELRDTLLPKLMSGEIDVSDIQT